MSAYVQALAGQGPQRGDPDPTHWRETHTSQPEVRQGAKIRGPSLGAAPTATTMFRTQL